MSEATDAHHPPIRVVFSDRLPDAVTVVYLPRLARVLVNRPRWRAASPAEREALRARLTGQSRGAPAPWGWTVEDPAATLSVGLGGLSAAAWDALLADE